MACLNFKENKGFSIVEMAMVVVVLGLLIALGFKMMGPLTDRIKLTKSNRTIDAAVASVIGFAQVNGRLPTVAEFPNVVKDSNDVWGEALIYRPDPRLLPEGSICAQSTTGTIVNTCLNGTCTIVQDKALNTAFFILSSGPNMNIQTLVDMTAASATTINTYPLDLINIDKDSSDMDRPEAYKDIARWVVLPELRISLGCAGSPLRILDIPIPSGVATLQYNADIFATGGVPWADAAGPPPSGDDDIALDYEWCVTSALPAGLTYQCSGALAVSASCSISPAAGTWRRCSYVSITGTPTSSSTSNLRLYARDDEDNLDTAAFALTINPIGGLMVCPEYYVWDDTTAVQSDYRMRHGFLTTDPITGNCIAILKDTEITAVLPPLVKGEVIEQYSTGSGNGTEPPPPGGCSSIGLIGRLTYNNAILTDTNGDCCIDFYITDPKDKVCP